MGDDRRAVPARTRGLTLLRLAFLAAGLLWAGLPCAHPLALGEAPLAIRALLLLFGAVHAVMWASLALLPAWALLRLRSGRTLVAVFLAVLLAYDRVDARALGLIGRHLDTDTIAEIFRPHARTTLGIAPQDLAWVGAGALAVGVAAFALLGPPLEGVVLLIALNAGIGGEFLVLRLVRGTSAAGRLRRLAAAVPLGPDSVVANLTGASPLDGTPQFPERVTPMAAGHHLAPRAATAPADPSALPDIVLLVVESLRSDALHEMPALRQLGARGLFDPTHLAAANCTRFTLFSLLTGLSPADWGAEGTARSPVALGAFAEAGYQLQIRGALFEEDKLLVAKTLPAGVAVTSAVENALPDARDRGNVDWLLSLLRGPPGAPVFAVVFLDGTHWPYFSKGYGLAGVPSVDAVEHMGPGTKDVAFHASGLAFVPERYAAAARQLDGLIGEVDAAVVGGARVRARPVLLAVVGDHGESLGEHLFHGHGSRLDDVEIHTPFAMAGPGVPRRELAGITTHQDVLPTLFALALGRPAPESPALGLDLTAGVSRPVPPLVAECGGDDPSGYAAVLPEGKLMFQLGPQGPVVAGFLGPGDWRAPLPVSIDAPAVARSEDEAARVLFAR